MEIETSRFGKITIEEDKIINFPEGIIGFSEHKQFTIISHDDKSPFIWLQSLFDAKIAFLIINPFLFISDYKPMISIEDLAGLNLKKQKDAQFYTIVIIPENPKEMTANLAAPVLINMEEKLAKQVILYNSEYNTKHKILDKKEKVS